MWRLAAGARAVADFRFDDRIEGNGACLEGDTQPGMTRTSFVPELAKFLRA
jgi:D-alanine-D-alanine ligase-like ATP-grasp enzyme